MLSPDHAKHLAQFRIPEDMLKAAGLRSVTDMEAREALGLNGHRGADLSGILFPYFSPDTNMRTGGRIRLDHRLPVDGGKYISEPNCRHLFFAPFPKGWLADISVPVLLVESEKAALATLALAMRAGRKLIPIALGGCWGWRRRLGKKPEPDGNFTDEKGPSPDFDLISWQGREVIACFDSNALTNPEVQQARRALAKQIAWREARVLVAEVPAIEGVNGPDDLIAVSGDDAMLDVLNAASPFETTSCSIADSMPPLPERKWPSPLAPEAFHGIAGEIVRVIAPHTEADPAALLFQFLSGVGNLIGRGPYSTADGSRHGSNLFAAIVGVSSKGRKGTAWNHIRRVLEVIDSRWAGSRIQSGLSSGEGLIWAVRDPIEKYEPIWEKKLVTGYQTVVADPGIEDKRLLVIEPELAATLRVMARDGSTLSTTIRHSWDTGDLRVLTKNSPARATGAHISVIGHVTRDELVRYLTSTDMSNGFANRFLWVCSKRSQELPEGGNIESVDLKPVTGRLAEIVKQARCVEELRRDEAARKIWREVYSALSADKLGLLGSVTSRAEAQVLRLSLLYALLDGASAISTPHLVAALAMWEYCEASATFIFGDALGYPEADRILVALRANAGGLTRTEIRDLFGRHLSEPVIGGALTALEERGFARRESKQTGGRPTERWIAVAPGATKAT